MPPLVWSDRGGGAFARIMAKPPRLKVYRTPIGFHDAYVAAPSQKAALEAWGSDANLFARGMAELVTDKALTREPLAHPGAVIKLARGSDAEHFAALPEAPKRQAPPSKTNPPADRSVRKVAAPKPKPRPSRTTLDKAEQVLANLERDQAAEEADLDSRLKAIERERATLRSRHDVERARASQAIERARTKYDQAIEAWRDG